MKRRWECMALTYYELLGVPPVADVNEIKRAYMRRVEAILNDGNQPDASQLATLHEAWTVLGSVSYRRRYDEELLARAAPSPQGARQPAGGTPPRPPVFAARLLSRTDGDVSLAWYAFLVPSRVVAMVLILAGFVVVGISEAVGQDGYSDNLPWPLQTVSFFAGLSILWILGRWSNFWFGRAVQRKRSERDSRYRWPQQRTVRREHTPR